jgi:triosephosphate isomerase (TIM)
MKYFIANWKAHKTAVQCVEWSRTFLQLLQSHPEVVEMMRQEQIKIVICPSYPFLFYIKQLFNQYPQIGIGTQDISMCPEGKYTGEVAATQIKDAIEYAIIGHSERRMQLNESEAQILKKLEQLNQSQILPILCVRNEKDTIYESAAIVAYEPIDAIGSGNNMQVADVIAMKQKLTLHPKQAFLYGGSVNASDDSEYLQSQEIDGFLIGTASLDADAFMQTVLQYKP